MPGHNFSVATLHRYFEGELNTHIKLNLLPILYPSNRKTPGSAKEMRYEIGLKDAGATNHYKHSILAFKSNEIIFETTQYRDGQDINTNLTEELGGLLTLLISIKGLFKKGIINVNAQIKLISNGKLCFMVPSSIYSIKSASAAMYYLESPVEVNQEIHEANTEELMHLMQEIANGFIAEPLPFTKYEPFMTIEPNDQKIALDTLINRLGPTLEELI